MMGDEEDNSIMMMLPTSFLDTPNKVQTVHAHFTNGHQGQPLYNLYLYLLYCVHVFYNVCFFAHLPFENQQRFRIRLYFSHVMLTNNLLQGAPGQSSLELQGRKR